MVSAIQSAAGLPSIVAVASLSSAPPSSKPSSARMTRAAPSAEAASAAESPAGPAPDDEDVAVRVAVGVAVRIRHARRLAETGGSTDHRLVDLVPEALRPHEGLVVEARDEDRRQEVVDLADVEIERGPMVLGGDDQALARLDDARPVVRVTVSRPALCPPVDRQERARLVRAVGQDAARAVILERAAAQMRAGGEQHRGDRVAAIAVQGLAVERDGQRLGAVDAAAGGKAKRLMHRRRPLRLGWSRRSARSGAARPFHRWSRTGRSPCRARH